MINPKNYFKNHGIQALFLLVFIVSIYGSTAFSNAFYVDAEAVINHPGGVYNWNEIGRFGLIGLKYLIGGNWYNPYFEGVMFLLTYWILACVSVYLVTVLLRKDNVLLSTLFAGLALFFPTYADQFMFRFQAFEIAFAMVLVMIAGLLFIRLLDTRKKGYAVAIVLLEVLSFGIYQSMVNLMIVIFAIVYLFSISYYEKKDRVYLIVSSIILFVIGFVIYEVIVKLFFSSGTYLSDSIGWTSGDLKATIMNLLAYYKHCLLSQDVFYPYTFTVSVLAAVGMLIFILATGRARKGSYALGIIAMLISPFLLSVLTGSPTAYRAQCMLPFACAAIIVFVLNELGAGEDGKALGNTNAKANVEANKANLNANKVNVKAGTKIIKCAAVCVSVVLIVVQCSVVLRLFYTQDTIRKNDEITAIEIMNRLNCCDTDGKPVVFAGHLEPKGNGSCYTKDQAQSFLAYSLYGFAYVDGVPVEDAEYCNTHRILGYFETLGFVYKYPTQEVVNKALAENEVVDGEAKNLYWPSDGSIVETDEYVFVRLSE